eukprot:CAMPEP_0203761214 /NCGR_PEP_ID=MMETSP0098-20131031/14349_1 /ASSEMBLY_ACC=CAM_ASM_000208 /TAXON_ID=96639 /ORGANISM=" , Strain NY0313808BC1" /LENGTH=251 /DNA_ID=CAMNT_0050655107 /DNA_START=146 /DNA_END=901 /DNA_ORIENTATION=+
MFHPVNFNFINGLHLKTIVHLSPEVTLRAVSSFIRDSNITLVHLGMKFWKPSGWAPICEDIVKEALEIVLDVRNHPLMLMCTSGLHQTGTIVGCLRRLQNRSFTSIIDELRSFAYPSHTRYANENFIEFFDVDLVSLPENLPAWFLKHQGITGDNDMSHESAEGTANKKPLPAYKKYGNRHNNTPLVEAWLKDNASIVREIENSIDSIEESAHSQSSGREIVDLSKYRNGLKEGKVVIVYNRPRNVNVLFN